MTHQVQIASGQYQVELPDGNLYDSGETVTLTDAQFGEISQNAFDNGVLVDLGAVKPSVTGSRGGNAALASLLTQLASLDLITDNTTA